VLDAYPGSVTEKSVHLPNRLEVGALSALTRLELCGHIDNNHVIGRDVPDTPPGGTRPVVS